MELLKLKERVEIATQMGESHFREFKSGFQGPATSKVPREIKMYAKIFQKHWLLLQMPMVVNYLLV